MRQGLLFSIIVTLPLLFPVVYGAEIVLYDIDFSSPSYTVGQPVPFYNSGPAPRIYPDYDSFGQQIVRAAYGELTDQLAEFVPSSTGVTYSQFGLNLNYLRDFPVYEVSFDLIVDGLEDTHDSFTVLFDTPKVVNTWIRPGGRLSTYDVEVHSEMGSKISLFYRVDCD